MGSVHIALLMSFANRGLYGRPRAPASLLTSCVRGAERHGGRP